MVTAAWDPEWHAYGVGQLVETWAALTGFERNGPLHPIRTGVRCA